MSWFTGEVRDDVGSADPDVARRSDTTGVTPVKGPVKGFVTDPVNGSAGMPTAAGRTQTPARRRALRRGVVRTAVLEPHSVTDARARVRPQLGVFPGQVRRPRAYRGLPAALVLSDVLALALAAALVHTSVAGATIFSVLVLATRTATRQYRPRMSLSVLDDLPRTLGALLVATGLTLAVDTVLSVDTSTDSSVLARAAILLAATTVLHAVAFTLSRRRRRASLSGRRTLVVGAERVGRTLVDALFEHPEFGLTPVGFADPQGRSAAESPLALPVLTEDMTRLARIVVDHEIDTVILSLADGDEHVDTVITLHQTGCEVLIVPSMFEVHHDGPSVERIRGIPVLRLRPDPTLQMSWWIKRSFDVVVCALGLLVLAVPLAVVALLVLLESGRPVLFWQERIGLDGKAFRLCKFRSMRPRPESESQTTWNVAGDPEVTRTGRFLRRSSVDEIPQLWNVLRGQMSLVGPRPERPGFVEKFSQEHERYWARHRVPVGLTGLAQVNGLRGDTSIRERARYDNYYIANWSLWLDAKIMMLTVREVIGGRGR